MRALWLLFSYFLLLLDLVSLAAGQEASTFSVLDTAAADIVQSIKKVTTSGKIMIVGDLAYNKYLLGYNKKDVSAIDIYETTGFKGNWDAELVAKNDKFIIETDAAEKGLYFKTGDGKSVKINFVSPQSITGELWHSSSAQPLKSVKPGQTPYISVEELMASKLRAYNSAKGLAKVNHAVEIKHLMERWQNPRFKIRENWDAARDFRGQHNISPLRQPRPRFDPEELFITQEPPKAAKTKTHKWLPFCK